MRTLELVLIGGAVGLVVVALVKYSQVDRSIDPATGGVRLDPNEVYGPAEPATVVEGLS